MRRRGAREPAWPRARLRTHPRQRRGCCRTPRRRVHTRRVRASQQCAARRTQRALYKTHDTPTTEYTEYRNTEYTEIPNIKQRIQMDTWALTTPWAEAWRSFIYIYNYSYIYMYVHICTYISIFMVCSLLWTLSYDDII